MAKFHINGKGVPAPCKATKGNCPFGDEAYHFESAEVAQEFIDDMNEGEHGLLPETNQKHKVEIAKERLITLFDDLVPSSGKSDNVAGELVRAVNRIAYRFYNDGDQVNSGYGNETCNSSLRYINEKLSKLEGGDKANKEFEKLWEGDIMYDDDYENQLNTCISSLVDFVDSNPSLLTETNNEDSTADFREPEDYNYDDDYDDEDGEVDYLYEDGNYWDEEDEDLDPYGNPYDDDF